MTCTAAAARRRLLRDLNELHAEPLETITAALVDDSDIFHWSANVRPLDGSLLGACFHFHLRFPQDYPRSPPHVSFTRPPSFHHPNVYGDEDCFICLDMLRWYETAEPNKGWTSAYTVQSVLLQLQSFLIGARDVDQDYGGAVRVRRGRMDMRAIVQETLRFKCTRCAHCGTQPVPSFFREHVCHLADGAATTVLTDMPCQVTARGRRVVVENRREMWMAVQLPGVPARPEEKSQYHVRVNATYRCTGKLNQASGLGLARVGWGLRTSTGLGVDESSVGYGGTGKLSNAGTYTDYGPPFGEREVVSAVVDGQAQEAYFVSGRGRRLRGIALTFTREGQELVPMLAIKNCAVEISAFGEALGPRRRFLPAPRPAPTVRGARRYRGDAARRVSGISSIVADVLAALTVQEAYAATRVCTAWRAAADEWGAIERREVVCFVTKLGPRAATLGLGLSNSDEWDGSSGPEGSRSVCGHLLSAEAFDQGVRRSPWKDQSFSLFLPLPLDRAHAHAARSRLRAVLPRLARTPEQAVLREVPALMMRVAAECVAARRAPARHEVERALRLYSHLDHVLRWSALELGLLGQLPENAWSCSRDAVRLPLVALAGVPWRRVAGAFLAARLSDLPAHPASRAAALRRFGAQALFARIAGAETLQHYERRLGAPRAGSVAFAVEALASLVQASEPGDLERVLAAVAGADSVGDGDWAAAGACWQAELHAAAGTRLARAAAHARRTAEDDRAAVERARLVAQQLATERVRASLRAAFLAWPAAAAPLPSVHLRAVLRLWQLQRQERAAAKKRRRARMIVHFRAMFRQWCRRACKADEVSPLDAPKVAPEEAETEAGTSCAPDESVAERKPRAATRRRETKAQRKLRLGARQQVAGPLAEALTATPACLLLLAVLLAYAVYCKL